MKTFQVSSSNGILIVEVSTGVVVKVSMNPDGEGLDQIYKFDIREWERFHGSTIKEHDNLDILDLGYWHKDGYEPPVEDWREMIKEEGIITNRTKHFKK